MRDPVFLQYNAESGDRVCTFAENCIELTGQSDGWFLLRSLPMLAPLVSLMSTCDKKEKIMRAAERLFASRRFHEITTEDIAQAAGVGKGTIYRHFKDKDDLYFSTAAAGFESLCQILESMPPGSDKCDYEKQLCEAARQISSFFESRRQWMRMMPGDESLTPSTRKKVGVHWQQSRARLLEVVRVLIEQGQNRRFLRHEAPASVLAAFFLGNLRTRFRYRDNLPAEYQSPEAAVALFLRGAAVHPAKVCCDQTSASLHEHHE